MSKLNEIITEDRGYRRGVPAITCKDGYRISVQASTHHYCLDANGQRGIFNDDKVALPFQSVECGFPSERPEPWAEWEQYAESPERPTDTVYGFVPVSLVADLIERHGGEA